jgi:hypothetical protein
MSDNSEALRTAFEQIIAGSPYERDVRRFADDGRSAWPGNYRDGAVDLAWCVLRDCADALAARGAQAEQWISVEDRLPEKETDVLAWTGVVAGMFYGDWLATMAPWPSAQCHALAAATRRSARCAQGTAGTGADPSRVVRARMSADLTAPLSQECADYATSLRSAVNVIRLEGREAPPSFLRAADLFERSAAELASLQSRLDAAERDAARIAALQVLLHWDGHAYWLPDLCIKEREYGNEYTTVPTLDELRAAIDAATQEQPT